MSLEEMIDSPGETGVEAARPSVSGFLERDKAEWEAFVDRHPHGNLFHTLEWRDAIRATFRHDDMYLVARRGERMTGILPLVKVSSLVFGTTFVSVPFGVYGGLLVDDEASATVLVEHARQLCRSNGAKYVELRHLHAPVTGLPSNRIYHTFLADVPDTKEGCLERIPRKARAEVRKALANEKLTVEHDTLDLAAFHRLFSLNKRRLGSPLFPSSLFWHMRRLFGDRCRILSVKAGEETIAAVMSFIHKGVVMPYYSGSLEDADSKHRASNFMYFRLMEWASEQKLSRFDFGRSREDTGAFQFKLHQGFTPTQLSYDYILEGQAEMPSLNPSNPKYRLAREVFRRLPMPLAQRLGSWLVKRAPF